MDDNDLLDILSDKIVLYAEDANVQNGAQFTIIFDAVFGLNEFR